MGFYIAIIVKKNGQNHVKDKIMENLTIIEDIKNIGENIGKLEVLMACQDLLAEKDPRFTYKKGTKEYEWDIFLDGEYFYTFYTPVFKVLDIYINGLEWVYNLAKTKTLGSLVEKMTNEN